jgi:hypothetical protein
LQSGYAVFNTPVIVGMLIPNQSLLRTVMWHSINQTHNATVNYANRNATQPTPINKLLEGYAGMLWHCLPLPFAIESIGSRAVSDFFCATRPTAYALSCKFTSRDSHYIIGYFLHQAR